MREKGRIKISLAAAFKCVAHQSKLTDKRVLARSGPSDVFIVSSLILVVLSAQIAGREADTIAAASGPSPAFYLPPSPPATSRSAALRSRCLLWRQQRHAGADLEFLFMHIF